MSLVFRTSAGGLPVCTSTRTITDAGFARYKSGSSGMGRSASVELMVLSDGEYVEFDEIGAWIGRNTWSSLEIYL